MSRDPIGFAGGGSNLYEYVGNNPTNLIDPSGLKFIFADAASAITYFNLYKNAEGSIKTLMDNIANDPDVDVTISSVPMKNYDGLTTNEGSGKISIVIDPNQSTNMQSGVLAHELVHVDQILGDEPTNDAGFLSDYENFLIQDNFNSSVGEGLSCPVR